MAHPGEASAQAAAAGAAMDSSVLAIVIAATVSTSVFIVAILILLLLLYHRDPMCCQFLCSCRLFQTPSPYDRPPPYFSSSSQRLVGPQRGASRLESAAENPGLQGDEVFCVGRPSSYQLPSWEQPCLPSYESVRKKDRQREIHQMIAERFGLWAEPAQELPPPYEHALRHPPAFSGTGMISETLDRRGVPDPFQGAARTQTSTKLAIHRDTGEADPAIGAVPCTAQGHPQNHHWGLRWERSSQRCGSLFSGKHTVTKGNGAAASAQDKEEVRACSAGAPPGSWSFGPL
ncbi:uncharacterized protein LOC128854020 isoform X2 [Cuculus canorus]|uniref:uncharacterized protein LOC128854020 isoform X2 n=1 Tax=Cuculus canorus TaxID=55661 RepID=UPI0023AA86B2|nr:uncharacterized protein LOC128854020 isoform X2 [Cuculus canorus]